MRHISEHIDLKRLFSFLAALVLCASLCLAPLRAAAAPADESEAAETARADEPERGTIRGGGGSDDESDDPEPSAARRADNDDEDADEEAADGSSRTAKNSDEDSEAEPTATPDPRVGADGKPNLSENESAVLLNLTNGEIMFEKDKDKRVYPASTTKIMTALLTLEAIERGEISLHAAFLVMPEMLENLPADGSSMLLKEGETITVEQLLQGLIVQSGNDAAQALAIIVCGDIPTFVERMNARAAELEMTGTNFVNVHGLHDDNHYTTAADMAKLAAEAMKNSMFRDLAATARVVIPATDKTTQRTFISTNGLLSTLRYPNYYYEYATGIKTGHTSQAGYCMVSSAKKGDLEVIGVLMNGAGEDDRHFDSRNLLKYAIDNYKTVTAVSRGDMVSEIRVRFGSGADHTTLSADSDIKVTIPVDANEEDLVLEPQTAEYLVAPVNQGDEIGTVNVKLNGEVVGSGKLFADNGVKRHPLGFLMRFFSFLWSVTIIRVLIILILAALVIFAVYMFVKIRKNIKIAERRRRISAARPRRREK